jgi:hypothetical protein
VGRGWLHRVLELAYARRARAGDAVGAAEWGALEAAVHALRPRFRYTELTGVAGEEIDDGGGGGGGDAPFDDRSNSLTGQIVARERHVERNPELVDTILGGGPTP